MSLRLTLCETCFASGWLTQDCWATHAQHHCLSVAKHRRDLVAAWTKQGRKTQDDSGLQSRCFPPHGLTRVAVYGCTWTFHIHKVRVGTLNETLLLVPPLLLLGGWVQQVFCELHLEGKREKGYTSDDYAIFVTNELTCKRKKTDNGVGSWQIWIPDPTKARKYPPF